MFQYQHEPTRGRRQAAYSSATLAGLDVGWLPPRYGMHRARAVKGLLAAFCSAAALCAVVAPSAPAIAKGASIYAPWKNGPPQNPAFFPIAVWWQAPAATGHSGAYPTEAAAVAGEKMNTFLGIGASWPEAFGSDDGELEIIKANNLYLVGGIYTPYNQDSSAQSVASIQALAQSIGATANVIGYNAGDEPVCGPPDTMAAVPGIVSGITGFDKTRPVFYNETAWMITPPSWSTQTCLVEQTTALKATSVGSFDLYPLTDAWLPQVALYSLNGSSDFRSRSNDTLWLQGMAVQALIHDGRPSQPTWVYIEAGGDNLGFSGANNKFPASVAAGSTTLSNSSGFSSFTATWQGLTVSGSGIPANTKITGIIDATHATMSAAATSSGSNVSVTVTGGDGSNSDCVASANLCVVNGNEYRPTAAQVNAEVWMSLISGASGIEYFCNDVTSSSFCLGDVAGGAAAAAVQANLTSVNTTVLDFARELNAPTVGICSMQGINYSTGAPVVTSSCTNGILTMATSNAATPGLAMVHDAGGTYYLFAQSDRRSPTGATFTFTLAGLAGKTAKTVYDSNERYDSSHSSRFKTVSLNGSGQFSDVLGANGDDYEVKIYRID